VSCTCEVPNEPADPRHAGECCKCGRPITGPGISTDETLAEFFDRLEAGMFHLKAPAKERAFFRQVKALAKHREREGRVKFGLDYLGHDAMANVAEEAVDAVLYLYLRGLRTRRETGEDEGLDLLLQASSQFIGALETAMQYPAKRRGSP
jgi:hypothetical protein